MVNCKICPIRAECVEIKEGIIDESIQDMRCHIHVTVDYCPLIALLSQDLTESVDKLVRN